MYELKIPKNLEGKDVNVILSKGRYYNGHKKTILLNKATQDEMKFLFETIKHPYIKKVK